MHKIKVCLCARVSNTNAAVVQCTKLKFLLINEARCMSNSELSNNPKRILKTSHGSTDDSFNAHTPKKKQPPIFQSIRTQQKQDSEVYSETAED